MSKEYESKMRKIELLEINNQTVFQQNHICILNGEKDTCIINAPDSLKLNQEVDTNAECIYTQKR